MARTTVIVILTALMLATGVAGADPGESVRVPISMNGPALPGAGPETVVVRRGDHLWKISAKYLDQRSPETAIAPYWREVVDVNTPRLRSRDPDLIYPGEVVELPQISAQP